MLGIPTLATGVFGGIIVGVLAASMYNKFYTIELPQYLGFFAGKRFVPIITSISCIAAGTCYAVYLAANSRRTEQLFNEPACSQ